MTFASLRAQLAGSLALSQSGPLFSLWLAACIVVPVLGVGIAGGLPTQWDAMRQFPLSDARLTAGLAAALVFAACFWLSRRRQAISPWPFVVMTTAIAFLLRFAYADMVGTAWTNDFLLYWEIAVKQVETGNYQALNVYYERSLPVLVPLILLFGPIQEHVILANITMMAMVQLAGYDILRRMHSHQAAQAFTAAFIAAPIPLFAVTIPSHDLWAMWYCALALWMCAVLLTHRRRRGTLLLAAVSVALALVCVMMEIQRGIGVLLAAAMVLAAIMGWLAAGADIAKRGRALGLLLVCTAALAAQWPLGTLASGMQLRAADTTANEIHLDAYYAANGTSLGDGTWGWLDGFRREFTEPLRTNDPRRLAQFSKSMVLSDWAEQPGKRLENIADRKAGLFALDHSNFWYFTGVSPTLDRPLGWLRLYSLFFSLAFTVGLGVAAVTLLLGRQPSVPTLAGLVLTSVVALALSSFSENQPRYLMMIWFTGLLFLAEMAGRRQNPGAAAFRLGGGMTIAVLVGWLCLVGLLLLPARMLYGPEDGRILSEWTRASTGAPAGELPDDHVRATDPGRLAVMLGPGDDRVEHALCLKEGGPNDLATFVRAETPRPGDTLLVGFGDEIIHRVDLGKAGGKAHDVQVHDIGSGNTCQTLSLSLESAGETRASRVAIFFPRLEDDPDGIPAPWRAPDAPAAALPQSGGPFVPAPLGTRPRGVFELPIAYHRLSENWDLSGTGNEYRALVETFDDRTAILVALDQAFTGESFSPGERTTAGQVMTVTYSKEDGTVAIVRLMPKPDGTQFQAPDASGLLHLTWRQRR